MYALRLCQNLSSGYLALYSSHSFSLNVFILFSYQSDTPLRLLIMSYLTNGLLFSCTVYRLSRLYRHSVLGCPMRIVAEVSCLLGRGSLVVLYIPWCFTYLEIRTLQMRTLHQNIYPRYHCTTGSLCRVGEKSIGTGLRLPAL